tara:strand:- start:3383 stop:3757 length:375 start_codon:yes stop_codon:yes gene_type:complete
MGNKSICTGSIVVNSCHDDATDGCDKYVMDTDKGLHQCVQHRILRNKCMPAGWDGKKIVEGRSCSLPAPDAETTDDGTLEVSMDLDGNRTSKASGSKSSNLMIIIGAIAAVVIVGGIFAMMRRR